MPRPAPSRRAGPFVVAHRGCSEDAPENTLPAFEMAMEAGIEIIECDVHRSRDGVAVVIHDATLDRTTNTRGSVAERDWADLSRVDAGYPGRFSCDFAGTPLPRLEQVLEQARGRAEVMIEIKRSAVSARSCGIEEAVLGALRSTRTLDDALVISMAPRVLQRFAAVAPAVRTGLVFPRRARFRLVQRTLAAKAEWIIAASGMLRRSPALVSRAVGAGLRVGAYVVNDGRLLRDLVRIGVDSLASDRPVAMVPLLAGAAAGALRDE